MKRITGFIGLALIASIAFAAPPKAGDRLNGKVVRVADGDTLTLRVGSDNYVIQLAGIDAPEDGQDYSI